MSETLKPQFDSETNAAQIMQENLGDVGMALLEDQLLVWQELNERDIQSPLRESLKTGDTRLPKGTLLHGMGMHSLFDPEALASVAEKGIVSGELIGRVEDSETHGCADFFRVPEDTTVKDYIGYASEQVPVEGTSIMNTRGEKLLMRGVTFIVDPNAEGMDQLLVNDGYTNPDMEGFISPPAGRTPEDTAAVLGGIPKGAIAGIIVSDKFIAKEGIQDQLQVLFGELPILDHSGNLHR